MNAGTKINQIVAKATTEITNRVNALNALETRVNGMQKVSASDKSSISANLQAAITAMTTLQSQISTDQSSNNTSSLKTDVQSITKDYRIYALVLPQGSIAAASDRVLTITDALTTLSGKLQTRITDEQNAGADMSAAVTALADLNAKGADATTQANSAVSGTASLQPDNGNTTIAQSNTAALKSARTDLRTAQSDIKTARQDASTIVQAIKAAEKSTGGVPPATTTASGTSQ